MVPTGSVRGERAQEALLNRDAEGATDRNFALVEQGLEGVLGIEKTAAIVVRAAGGEPSDSRHHKGE